MGPTPGGAGNLLIVTPAGEQPSEAEGAEGTICILFNLYSGPSGKDSSGRESYKTSPPSRWRLRQHVVVGAELRLCRPASLGGWQFPPAGRLRRGICRK